MNVLDILKDRGFIENTTHDEELSALLSKEKVTCYVGFDPTGDSLHVGHLLPVMALAHMQQNGHRPLALLGGGTGLIGDPSGKTETRQVLSAEMVMENVRGLELQLSHFLDFSDEKALLLNNAAWLTKLKYIDFLRDIGRHFSINRMIKAESYRARLESETNLSFTEFNYMLLQAYDFLHLNTNYNCNLQMGGSDQWGNIVAGVELNRRIHGRETYGITLPLIMTSRGIKMGKTHKGAVWLDGEKTSPYEYFQFWVNTDDKDVSRFLALFTFLPMDEIRKINEMKGAELNIAKTILAFEATALAHGEKASLESFQAAQRLFGGRAILATVLPSSNLHQNITANAEEAIPTVSWERSDLETGVPAFKLFVKAGLVKSSGEAKRLIAQGGAYINGQRIDDADATVALHNLEDNALLLRAGKKRMYRFIVKEQERNKDL